MGLNNNQQVFLALLRAGLWGTGNTDLRICGAIDWEEVYQLAQEQSVQGLALQGLEWYIEQGAINKADIPKILFLEWIGDVQVMADQNKLMNEYVASLIETLRKNEIHPILVKGQGIAQCYEKPLWRNCGDIDLLLDSSDYEKAKTLLLPQAIDVEPEFASLKHLGMTMKDGFIVELHGLLHSRLSKRVDRGIDEAQWDVLYGENVRKVEFKSSSGSMVQVDLPAPDDDVIFVFTHILKHFYIEGIGLRQICDWCRLLWTYRDSLNHGLLEYRIRKMGLMSEWKAFYNLASKYLGMPDYGSGLMVHDSRYDKKADRIMEFVMEVGNFGHNRDHETGQSFLMSKLYTLRRRTVDSARHFMIFPKNAFMIWLSLVTHGATTLFDRR